MADDADLAAISADQHVAASILAARVTIPAGVAGTCEQCGDDMPRLVGGRCGFCRDGRRRPPSLWRAPPPADLSPPDEPVEEKEIVMSVPALNIAVHLRGELVDRVRDFADAHALTLGRAGSRLIEAALDAPPPPAGDPAIEAVPLDRLLAEIGRRFTAAAPPQELLAAREREAAASDRAAAAERCLEQVRAAIAPAA